MHPSHLLRTRVLPALGTGLTAAALVLGAFAPATAAAAPTPVPAAVAVPTSAAPTLHPAPAVTPTTAAAHDVAALRAELDALATEHVGDTTPGLMVAVVGPDGPLVLETWGEADPTTGTPLTPDSRTPVASVSKVVTSLTALTLHHEGLLDLDADIRDDLPVRDERATRTPVTGRHLLTHHAGLAESVLFHPDPADVDPTDLRRALEKHTPVLRDPSGIGLHYSPLHGHALLGLAIEDATGASFDEAVAQWVLDPVGATTADFHGPSDEPGDVALATRDGEGWRSTDWPPVAERPAAGLTWSARDAAALLHTLLDPDQDALPAAVVDEATTVAVRPAHGGGGHTQVFFESWRSEARVLEHAGANGLAWLALVPDAEIGVFTAVTTEDAAAADLTSQVLDTVAAWTVRTGLASADPLPAGGRTAVTPDWAAAGQPVAPVGAFHQRLFGARGPELALRTLLGQVAVSADGDDLRLGDRTLAPTQTPGRWCDENGCVAGVEAEDGTVLLLLGDRGMLEQTLVPAPWWADQRLVVPAVAGTVVLAGVALVGAVRAAVRRRRGRTVATAVCRPAALGWSLGAVALTVVTPLYVLSPLLTGSTDWLPADGAAVWGLRVTTAAVLVLGAYWLVRAVARWRRLTTTTRRVAVVPAALVGLAMSGVLVTWALPMF